MPWGVIAGVLAVIVGGLTGGVMKRWIDDEFREKMNMVFGVCSMGMGISAIMLMRNMPAVILALVSGSAVGVALHLGQHIERGGIKLQGVIKRLSPNGAGGALDDEAQHMLVTAIVLFCASGTGIYGAMVSGMSGDHSILFAKAILDVPTAMLFACTLGSVVAIIAVPQAIVFMALFFIARLIMPYVDQTMICDFRACGGFIMLATGLRIAGIKYFPIADMIPAMVLVLPLSHMWASMG